MSHWRGWISGLVSVIVLNLLVACSADQVGRLEYQRSLFTGAPQIENFARQEDFYPINEMPAADEGYTFPRGPALELPTSFTFADTHFETQKFLSETESVALLVLHDGKLRFEAYWLTGGPTVPWLTHSVSKSLVASALAIVLEEGLVADLADPIDKYVPALAISGYSGVSIRDILQMSSGIRWTEDYADPESDLNQFGKTIFTGASYDEFVAQRVRARPPGEFNSYAGMDTQALTMLIRRVTGVSLAEYVSSKIWQPMGMQDRAYWATDKHGVELGLGGLSASARDLAKIGELYRNQGIWLGEQILDPAWVRDATTVTAPHLARGPNASSKHSMGYGYQWWLPDGDEQDYSAIGIYNQFVYVNPQLRTVIVKLSAYRDYANTGVENPYLEAETFALFRLIASRLQGDPAS